MSGIVGHTMYAMLALKTAQRRKLPFAPVMQAHLASYITGAYLGSDIQTMPEAICADTGREVGYGTVPMDKSPITGGAVRPFTLKTFDGELRPTEVHERYYGRAHLVFGFTVREKSLLVPWDHLPDYFAAVCDDVPAKDDRALAYVLGWIVHVVSDSLIKGVHPGIDLKLLDGRYTARNRPVQDLITYHDIGENELRLDWPTLLDSMADTPVEAIQFHYMRCGQAEGALGKLFTDGWKPASAATLRAVLTENRRWVRQHARDVITDLQLVNGDCNARLRELSGLSYAEMRAAAQAAGFRTMLDRMADLIADMFIATQQRTKRLKG